MKIMRVFANLPTRNWYELKNSDYIFDTPVTEWLNSNPDIQNISNSTFVPIVIDGIGYMVHISNIMFG